MANILLVEDDENLAFMLCENLEIEGFDVIHLTRGENVLPILREHQINLLLLDVDLEDGQNGFDIAERVRLEYPDLPIIFTTGKTHFKDVERGLSLRNVDYQKKPYGTKELMARINNLLNRVVDTNKRRFVFSGFSFNPIEQIITIEENDIRIAKTEAAFLKLLCENINNVVTKETIVWELWNEKDISQKEHSLNNLAHKMRKCLTGNSFVELMTISKVGYKLVANN